jgi:hypothetical protein
MERLVDIEPHENLSVRKRRVVTRFLLLVHFAALSALREYCYPKVRYIDGRKKRREVNPKPVNPRLAMIANHHGSGDQSGRECGD